MVRLAEVAALPAVATILFRAGATPIFLRGLATVDTALQAASLRALLALSVHVPDAQQAMMAASLLETLLGMAFTKQPDVRLHSLDLLRALAAHPQCVAQLCQPTSFRALLAISRTQAELADVEGARRALLVVDALLLGGGLAPRQSDLARSLARTLAASEHLELAAAAARTLELCPAARPEDGFGFVTEGMRKGLAALQESLGSLVGAAIAAGPDLPRPPGSSQPQPP
jgi:hypothetical protein